MPSHDDLPERYPVLEHAERRRRELIQPWWNKRMSAGETTLCLLALGLLVEWAYRPLF